MRRIASLRSLSPTLLALAVIAAIALPAAADSARHCATKGACTKRITCKPGYGLVAAGHRFYCKKVSTKVTDQQTLDCGKGTLAVVDGADYCLRPEVRTPDCAKHKGFDDWEWRKAKKQCRRLGNDGAEHLETANIACPPGLTYADASGKCVGAVRDRWSFDELLAACDRQMKGSVYLQDFVGDGDRCAQVLGETDFAAPTLE